MFVAHVFQPQAVGVGYPHDFHAVGVTLGISGIHISPIPGSENEKRDGLLYRGFQIFYMSFYA